MQRQHTREWAKQNAKTIKVITVAEAKNLPQFLGKIVPVQLSMNGWYAHETGNGIVYYELRCQSNQF